MNEEKERAEIPGYLLDVGGKGGLGEIFIHVFTDRAIQLTSFSDKKPPETDQNFEERNHLYSAVIEVAGDGQAKVTMERSITGGREDYENPASNRPKIKDIIALLDPKNKSRVPFKEEEGIKTTVEKTIKKAFSVNQTP